ncbi:MAG: hypothetical protein IJ493_04120 [Clostridia bacterium]|nr:hypothetical protein [Clostridia bacterium]
MFGYIKPVPAELKVKEYELYRAVYCGLCNAMGRSTSCVSRLSLSYDFVFLALVRMLLADESGKIEKKRCAVHPTKKRPVLYEASQLDYCAKVSALLTYHKLRDDLADEHGFKRLACLALLPAAKYMRRRAKGLEGLDSLIAGKLTELSALERENCPSPDRAAEPFGELMAAVCAHGFEENSAEGRIAAEIGRHVGRYIYIIDAVDDLKKDIASGAYNPFLALYPENTEAEFAAHAQMVKNSLTMELMGIEAAVELIDQPKVPEYANIVRNIIYLGLPGLTDRLCGDCTQQMLYENKRPKGTKDGEN